MKDDGTDRVDAATAFVRGKQTCSANALQRHFGISFVSACQLVDTLQARGVLGPWQGNGRRKVLTGSLPVAGVEGSTNE